MKKKNIKMRMVKIRMVINHKWLKLQMKIIKKN
jgi:hypothetical protein